MQWGDKLPMFEEMMETSGIMPKALRDRPVLTGEQDKIYSSFIEIATGRNYSMSGPLPVGLSETLAYCTLYGLEREEAQDLWKMVRALDSHWLSEVGKRTPPPAKTSKKP